MTRLELKQTIEDRIKMLNEQAAIIERLNDKLFDDDADDFYMGVDGLVVIVRDDYEKLKRVKDNLENTLHVIFERNMTWTSGRKVITSWENGEYYVTLWFECAPGNVPEEILGTCQVEEFEVKEKEYRIICKNEA
jgi:hypothetical protein